VAYVIVCVVALVASALTLISGFGLGTLLLPAFALIFPIEIAVSATAVVHLANNLFKLTLVGRYARLRIVLAFGVPAAASALVGAWVLTRLADLPALLEYDLHGRTCTVTPVNVAVSALIFVFAVLDLMPARRQITFRPKWIPLGGALSGFFGGLSGHQGALRSAFLINAGLTKEQFIGTGVTCAVLVDLSRLAVYGSTFFTRHFTALGDSAGFPLMIAATLCAFLGAIVGTRLMKKVTLAFVQRLVGVLLILMALALGSGLI
jgi:uncharacterized membrane protein YfcA